MATQILRTQFQFKRGLAEAWERNNPILAHGEPGWTLDTHILKVGDGSTCWNDLRPIDGIEVSEEDIQSAVDKYLKENPIIGVDAYTKIESDEKYATKIEIGVVPEGKTIIQLIEEIEANAKYDDSQIKADIEANANAIKALIDSDVNMSIRAIAADEVFKLVKDAPEEMNTFKKVAAWADTTDEKIATLTDGINSNKLSIMAIYQPATEESPAQGILIDEIAKIEQKIPGVDNKTIKLTENKAYIAEVSTDTLVQGLLELVLSSGNANGYEDIN